MERILQRILYTPNYPIHLDENILNDDRGACVEENLPILKSEVEHAIRSLKKGKSTGKHYK